jgi:hypothetical protein
MSSPQSSRTHRIACGLVIAIAIGLMFSSPVANLGELLLVAPMPASAHGTAP